MNKDQEQLLAEDCARTLLARDPGSHLLGIQLEAVAPGMAQMSLTVKPQMLNGHSTCHGGFIFALADTCFAFAANSRNRASLAVAGAIDFLRPVRGGDRLVATARELTCHGRIGFYEVSVINQRGEVVALFRGRAHQTPLTVVDDSK